MELNDDKISKDSNPPPYASNIQEPSQSAAVVTTPLVIQSNMSFAVPIVVGQQMGPLPASVACKSCHMQIVTKVVMKATIKTHLLAVLLCLVGCCCCVCAPYCMDSCNNADHYCPNCNAYIGSYVN